MMSVNEYSVITINNLSYMELLLPELKGKQIKLLQNRVPSSELLAQPLSQISIQHELTGSPLEYDTMNEDSFNITMLPLKKLWRKCEEYHTSIKKENVPSLITLYLEKDDENQEIPIFAICECEEKYGTIILGSYIQSNWFENIKVDALGLIRVSQIEERISLILEKHLAMFGAKQHQVTTLTSCEYELFGIKSEYINWNDTLKSNFEGSLSISSTWTSLSFSPNLRTSENMLFLEVALNTQGSLLKECWDELLLLNNYLNILEEYYDTLKTKATSRYTILPLNFPDNFSTPFYKNHEELINELTSMLKGEYPFPSTLEYNFIHNIEDKNEDIQIKLRHVIQKLSMRENLDFTDYLWMILKGFKDYTHIMDAIHQVLNEFTVDNGCIQINAKNNTRFAKVLKNTCQDYDNKFGINKPLEFLIDIGIEKLSNDYTYLLRSINFLNTQEVKQKLENLSNSKFSIDNYRSKLLIMAQINICLEFALLAESHLNYPMENLRQLLSCAYKKYCSVKSPVTTFSDVLKHVICNLTASGPAVIIKEVMTRLPFLYRFELSSSNVISKLKTVGYYSMIPIFPPNMYTEKESEDSETTVCEQMYYEVNVICSSLKIKP